ncbi:MAG: hypothetical protein LBL44_00790 [Treponema sp.]|jgi:hypothetical protein|nr:hypothetical protein [Treponema sp.]
MLDSDNLYKHIGGYESSPGKNPGLSFQMNDIVITGLPPAFHAENAVHIKTVRERMGIFFIEGRAAKPGVHFWADGFPEGRVKTKAFLWPQYKVSGSSASIFYLVL